jgi:phospholipid/cholesterol/gamma-HCH transport system substrate-binding protein
MRGLLAPLIKLLVFLVITVVATYVLAVTIANQSFGSSTTYHADFTDVTGLNLDDDVRIAGVRVGTVTGMKLIQGNANRQSYTEITFNVQKSRPLPTTVQAKLRYRNLVGQRYLDIEQGAGQDNSPMLKAGATIPLSRTTPAVDLTVLFQGFSNLTTGLAPDQINKLSYALIQTLQGEGGALENLLRTVADLTNSLADKDQLIGDVIDNLSSVLGTIGQRDSELSDLIVQLRTLLSGLAGDRVTIGNAIDGINDLATSTSSLLTNIRPPLKKDVTDLTGLVNNLNDNSSTVQYVVQQLAPTLAGLVRTASYGSWFNFYLCYATATVTVPTLSGKSSAIPIPNLQFGSAATRATRGCNGG